MDLRVLLYKLIFPLRKFSSITPMSEFYVEVIFTLTVQCFENEIFGYAMKIHVLLIMHPILSQKLIFVCVLNVALTVESSNGLFEWLFDKSGGDNERVLRTSALKFEVQTADDKFLMLKDVIENLSALDQCNHLVSYFQVTLAQIFARIYISLSLRVTVHSLFEFCTSILH